MKVSLNDQVEIHIQYIRLNTQADRTDTIPLPVLQQMKVSLNDQVEIHIQYVRLNTQTDRTDTIPPPCITTGVSQSQWPDPDQSLFPQLLHIKWICEKQTVSFVDDVFTR